MRLIHAWDPVHQARPRSADPHERRARRRRRMCSSSAPLDRRRRRPRRTKSREPCRKCRDGGLGRRTTRNGATMRDIAVELEEKGERTVRGCRWTIGSLRTLFGPDWYHLHARGTPSHLYDGAPLKGRARKQAEATTPGAPRSIAPD